MCDTYSAKCSHRGCNVYLPIHLEDFATERTEIRVYCKKHLPDHDVRVFTFGRLLRGDGPLPKAMGIRYLTDNARRHRDGNSPNTASDWKFEDRK